MAENKDPRETPDQPCQINENLTVGNVKSRTKKIKKPDIQIYVPRGRRLLQAGKDKSYENQCIDGESPNTTYIESKHHRSKPISDDVINELVDTSSLESANEINSCDLVEIDSCNQEIFVIPSKAVMNINTKIADIMSFDMTSNRSCDTETEDINQTQNEITTSEISIPVCEEKTKSNMQDSLHTTFDLEEEIVDLNSCDVRISDNVVVIGDDETGAAVATNLDHAESNDSILNSPLHYSADSQLTCVNKSDQNKVKKPVSQSKAKQVNVDECDWEDLFDESGDFVNNSLVEELMTAIGKVSVEQTTQNYRSFESAEERSSDGECIIELYGFPADFKTDDLMSVFSSYRVDQGFQLVWVDETHALAVFSSPFTADEVLNSELPFVKTRPLKNAIPKSRMKARNFVQQPAARPKTCVSLARRLVSGHLGMKINVPPQQREAERKLLSDAREKRRLIAKHKYDAWEGASGSDK